MHVFPSDCEHNYLYGSLGTMVRLNAHARWVQTPKPKWSRVEHNSVLRVARVDTSTCDHSPSCTTFGSVVCIVVPTPTWICRYFSERLADDFGGIDPGILVQILSRSRLVSSYQRPQHIGPRDTRGSRNPVLECAVFAL